MDQLELELQTIIDQTPAPAGNENKISAPFRLLLPLQKVLMENTGLLSRVVALEKELTEAASLQTNQATASNDGSAELMANVEKVPSTVPKKNNERNRSVGIAKMPSPSQPSSTSTINPTPNLLMLVTSGRQL